MGNTDESFSLGVSPEPTSQLFTFPCFSSGDPWTSPSIHESHAVHFDLGFVVTILEETLNLVYTIPPVFARPCLLLLNKQTQDCVSKRKVHIVTVCFGKVISSISSFPSILSIHLSLLIQAICHILLQKWKEISWFLCFCTRILGKAPINLTPFS